MVRQKLALEEAQKTVNEQKALNWGLVKFRKESPEIAKAMLDLWRKSRSNNALPTKVKELIAIGIVLIEKCKPCIFQHVQAALAAGATRAEIIDAANVAIGMGGGVVYEYVGYLMEALEYFEKQNADR